jgi:hypothetical protein
MYVVHNTKYHESMLKKKSKSICYHVVRELAAMVESITGQAPSVDNHDQSPPALYRVFN